ncbi:hypothetical protein ABH944_008476 [Caballeronia udeis]|jgi:hypothetical protein|uniref:Transposase n=1 Tax=Caballeronia udeis TaxID=1232866 RepID=A0ABW8MXH4_9BURK
MHFNWTGIQRSRRTCTPTHGTQDFAIENAYGWVARNMLMKSFEGKVAAITGQIYLLWFHRKMQERGPMKPHSARPAQAAYSTPKDIA